MKHEMAFTFLACADVKRVWEAITIPSNIWGATVSEGLAAGQDFAKGFARHCELIAENPEMGSEREGLQHGLRSSQFRKCVIFYRVRGPRVEVLRVLRADRDSGPGT